MGHFIYLHRLGQNTGVCSTWPYNIDTICCLLSYQCLNQLTYSSLIPMKILWKEHPGSPVIYEKAYYGYYAWCFISDIAGEMLKIFTLFFFFFTLEVKLKVDFFFFNFNPSCSTCVHLTLKPLKFQLFKVWTREKCLKGGGQPFLCKDTPWGWTWM